MPVATVQAATNTTVVHPAVMMDTINYSTTTYADTNVYPARGHAHRVTLLITASRVALAIGDGPVSIPVATVQVVANIMVVHLAVMMVTIETTTPSKGAMNASSVCQDAHHVLITLIASRVQVQAIGEQLANTHVQRVMVDSATLKQVNAPMYALQMNIS